MKQQFYPNSDRVLIELILEEKVGSLFVPERFREANGEPRLGKVVAVGPGKNISDGELLSPLFGEGDVVLVDMLGGMKIKLNGVEHLLVRNEEILGTLFEVEEEKKPTLTSV